MQPIFYVLIAKYLYVSLSSHLHIRNRAICIYENMKKRRVNNDGNAGALHRNISFESVINFRPPGMSNEFKGTLTV